MVDVTFYSKDVTFLLAEYSPALFPIIHATIRQPQAGTEVSMATD